MFYPSKFSITDQLIKIIITIIKTKVGVFIVQVSFLEGRKFVHGSAGFSFAVAGFCSSLDVLEQTSFFIEGRNIFAGFFLAVVAFSFAVTGFCNKVSFLIFSGVPLGLLLRRQKHICMVLPCGCWIFFCGRGVL